MFLKLNVEFKITLNKISIQSDNNTFNYYSSTKQIMKYKMTLFSTGMIKIN